MNSVFVKQQIRMPKMGVVLALAGLMVWVQSGFAQYTRTNPQYPSTTRIRNTGNQVRQTPPQQNRSRPPQTQENMIQTVAMVNGQTISRQHLANETVRRFGETVIESVINKQLIYNELNRQGISVTHKDVNDEIARQAAKLRVSVERYLEVIQSKRNISISRIKNDIFWMELALRRLAENQIQVNEQEVAKRMETEFGEKVMIRVIALDDPEKAKQIHAAVTANPQSFGQMAIKHSIDPNSASRRGALPPIRKHTGDPKLEQVAFSLKPGEISQVVEFGDPQLQAKGAKKEFFILYCERKFPATRLTEIQASGEKQRIIEEIKNDKLRGAASNLFKRLQQTVKIVNVYNDEELKKSMPGVAATVDGQPITMRYLSEECIARYGVEILDSLLNRTLLQQALQKTGMRVENEDVQKEIVRTAESYGWVKKGQVDVQGWLNFVTRGDKSKVTFYVEDEVWPSVALRKLVEKTVEVTDADLQKGFIANFGERVMVQAVVVNDNKLANKVWKMARDNPTEQFFGQLSNEYSSYTELRNNYGEFQPIQRYGSTPFLEEEAFRLKTGDISAIVQHGRDWIILRCKGRTKPEVTDFDAVKDMLRQDIYEKKLNLAMDKYFGQLRTSAQIDNFMTGTSQTGREAVESARRMQQGQGQPRR